MADFCRECSIKIFGEDFGDLKFGGSVKDRYGVICEGCGFIEVDETGTCTGGENCLEHHQYNPNDTIQQKGV